LGEFSHTSNPKKKKKKKVDLQTAQRTFSEKNKKKKIVTL
jgi:hypothetical protein